MKYQLIIIFYVFLTGQVYSQKEIHKTLDTPHVFNIMVNGDNMFKINVSTHKTKKIDMYMNVEGDNNEQVLLLSQILNDTLYVSNSYQPLFVPTDNKSSAHKHISIELILTVPEGMNIYMKSDIASVFVTGNYQDFKVELLNGHFSAKSYSGNLMVNTLLGDIDVETNNGLVDCNTRKGIIKTESLPLGQDRISLISVNGDITVTKTE